MGRRMHAVRHQLGKQPIQRRSIRTIVNEAPDKSQLRIADANEAELLLRHDGQSKFRGDRLCPIKERSKGMTYAAEQNQSPHAAQATLPLIGPLIGNRHPERAAQSHELADDRVASRGLKVLFERLRTDRKSTRLNSSHQSTSRM